MTSNNVFETEEAKRQQNFIQKIKSINDLEYKNTGKRKYFFSLAMGCQMNAHDSEKLAGMLTEMGYLKTDEEDKADFIIYNTCCIRENAENKVFGKLGYLKYYKQNRPDIIIAICGCMMQQQSIIEKLMEHHSHIDIIFGTFNIYKLPELLQTRLDTGKQVIDIWEENKEIVEDLPSIRRQSFKASVNIMYGCDNFCSYCIVPYVRGRERSRASGDIISEIKKLRDDGVKEVMLLGQNVNSYGKKLEESVSFAALLRKINEIEGISRIRFMTSHPKDLSDELIYSLRDCKNVCKYIHLPIQSGSDDVLQRMNRKYTKEKYLTLTEKLKKEIPNISISTDIIVGFPGETEKDFLETLDVVDKVGFSTAFTFIYSKRAGTKAAVMDGQVPEEIAKERFERLLEHVNSGAEKVSSSCVGSIQNVLVEEKSKTNNVLFTGRTDGNLLVHLKGSDELVGQIIPVRITDNKTFYLLGERVGTNL